MQLMPVVARQPAGGGLALNPLKPTVAHTAMATVPNRGSSSCISHSSAPLLPASPGSVREMGRRSSCPVPRTKARDDEAEGEHQQAPAAKQGEDEQAAAETERKAAPGERSMRMAYQIFAGLYVCAYVFCWRTGTLISLNAQDAFERLRRYVRDKFFNQKR